MNNYTTFDRVPGSGDLKKAKRAANKQRAIMHAQNRSKPNAMRNVRTYRAIAKVWARLAMLGAAQ